MKGIMRVNHQIFIAIFMLLSSYCNYAMYHNVQLSDTILCATFIGKDRIAIGTKKGCDIFRLEDNRIIFERQLFDHPIDNLTTNRNQALLATTCSNQSTSFIYDAISNTVTSRIHLIELGSQSSCSFLHNNQLLVLNQNNIHLPDYVRSIKLLETGDWLETIRRNIYLHPTKNIFLCHSNSALYLVEYNELPYPRGSQLERASFLIHYKQALFNSSGTMVAIRNSSGDVVINYIEKNNVHDYKIVKRTIIGSDKDTFIQMCFHTCNPYIIATLTNQAVIKCWNCETNQCIAEISLPYKNNTVGIIASLKKQISSYFFNDISCISFDTHGKKLLATLDNQCFVIKNIDIRLLNTHENFNYYKILYALDQKYPIPKEIRWFIMRLVLTTFGTQINF